MAFGFTPRHTENIQDNDLNQEQFLVVALEAAKKLEWDISYFSQSGFIAYTNKGFFGWNAEVKIKIENTTAQVTSSSTGSEIMDLGKNKKTALDFVAKFNEVKSTLTKEEIDAKYLGLKPSLDKTEQDLLTLPPPTKGEQIKGFFSIFVPKEGFYVTPLLLDINILIFVLMVASGANILLPENEILLNWGANFRPYTLDGQWFRLITNCFLHIGIIHLLLNMYALLYIGVLLEPLLGKVRFVSAYLLTGVTASLASLWWHELTISAGASGAIFGMYGVFLSLLTTNLIEKNARKALLTSITVFVGYNLVYGMKGGIDNAAHIGGLLGGVIIGYAFIPSLRKADNAQLRYLTIGISFAIVFALSLVALNKIPNDIGIYDTKMKDFVAMESMALEVYELPPNTTNEEFLSEIKDRGIYYWNKNIDLLNSFEKLELPLVIRTRNRLLKEYCELRIKNYEFMYQSVSDKTDGNELYQQKLNDFNQQIEAKIKEIGEAQ